MNRTVFLVDGFNLYHSVVEASRDATGTTTKWLDIKKLCFSYLPIAGKFGSEKATLERVYYFSAPPTHRTPDKLGRHLLFMKCLRATGINVELARFKQKEVYCPNCKRVFITHAEKETDVAIAARLFEVCCGDECETVILMTGDTDLAPAVRVCKRMFPSKLVFFAFPYKRTNRELAGLAPESFSIKLKAYLRNQFPDPLVLPDGTAIQKPSNW
ncbi:MAG: NYN domain-containing protein [Candidatus Eisenbacteria bacterium]|nr:NYN domain-containing protein [Candidatus Eisenbacteria bacterium]